MIYIDGVQMIGDTVEELHQFARKIVLSKCWFHNTRINQHAHYDVICSHKLNRALELGAKLVSKKEIRKIMQKNLAI